MPSRLLTIALALCCAAAAQDQPLLHGTALNAITGEPLPRVQIHLLNRDAESTQNFGALTDDNGRFSTAIVPGSYLLQPACAGFILSALIPPIEIKPGQPLPDLKVEMSPRALISGRVTNDAGDPVPHLRIAAESASGNDILLQFTSSGTGATNDLGDYRIAVPPGKYRVRAEVSERLSEEASEIRTDGSSAAVYATTWFPNARTSSAGAMVNARAGAETAGTDIRFALPLMLSISGSVTGAPPGAEPSIEFNAFLPRRNQIFDFAPASDNTFFRTGLAPGRYLIYAMTPKPPLRSAVVHLDLKEASIENVNLALHPMSDLPGTIQGPVPPNARVVLHPLTDLAAADSSSSPIDRKGAFTIPALAPERYAVALDPLQPDAYIAAVRLNGDLLPNNVADLRSGAANSALKIVVTTGAARISGKLVGKSVVEWQRGTRIYLAPERDDSPDSRREVVPNPDGTYNIDSIAPGRYRLYAIDLSAQSSEPPEPIELKPGQRLTKDLKPSAPPVNADR